MFRFDISVAHCLGGYFFRGHSVESFAQMRQFYVVPRKCGAQHKTGGIHPTEFFSVANQLQMRVGAYVL